MRKVGASFVFLMLVAGACLGQESADQWLRVSSGDDYVIEIDKTSLILISGGVIGADFRTTYANPERIDETSTLEYRSRIDSIEFKTTDPFYRVTKSSLFDRSGKTLIHYSAKAATWKRRNATGSRFYLAASKLAPFGYWNVLSYHYASGEAPSADDPAELRQLVGRTIYIKPDYLFIGNPNCGDATLDFRSVSDADLAKYGLSLNDFGVDSPNIRVIVASCKSGGDYPPQTYLFLKSSSKAKLLWHGVFFDIERPPNTFTP